MQRAKNFPRVRFAAAALTAIDAALGRNGKEKRTYRNLSVDLGNSEQWTFDTLGEFLASAGQGLPDYTAYAGETWVRISSYLHATRASVDSDTRESIDSIFAVIERHAERCRVPESPEAEAPKRVFIGHGRDPQWKDLKDHLREKHHYDIEAYEIGSRAGHTIRDILAKMLTRSSVALLVMTGEDEAKDGTLHARQNVVHEAGLFQGKLGFTRAIVLLEDGTEEFSNIHGIEQIRFPKGKIRETFGDVLAFLKRELP